MKKIIIITFILFFMSDCTKLGEPSMHPSDWTDIKSENSHMAKIAVIGIENCKSCHGGLEKHDFFGGTSGVSCYQCHAGGPSGHPAFSVWVGTPEHNDFHGKEDQNRCAQCHGEFSDESGGLAKVSCSICHDGF